MFQRSLDLSAKFGPNEFTFQSKLMFCNLNKQMDQSSMLFTKLFPIAKKVPYSTIKLNLPIVCVSQVDPTLHGDTHTRRFIRFDVSFSSLNAFYLA